MAEYDSNQTPTPPPTPPTAHATTGQQPVVIQQAAPKKSGWRKFVNFLLGVSLVLNVYLLFIIGSTISHRSLAKTTMRDGDPQQGIALYEISGVINDATYRNFAAFHDEIAKDDSVRAVLLRINSPGGTVSASDQIHHLLRDLQDKGKTIVVSMGGLAASGGYYIAAPAREILAEPTTVTGSIGVIATIPNFQGTAEKLGVKFNVIKSTDARAWKDLGSTLRPMEPRERERLREILNSMQDKFETVVRSGRGEKLNTTEEDVTIRETIHGQTRDIEITETVPFNGKVYMAEEAVAIGLVDRIGYLDDAQARTAELLGLTDPHIIRYTTRPSLIESVLFGKSAAPLIELNELNSLQTPQLLMMWKVR